MLRSILLLIIVALWCRSANAQEGVVLKRVPSVTGEFGAAAVVVDQGCLMHTAQLSPLDDAGNVASDQFAAQLERIVGSLHSILKSAGIDESSVVRLQVNLLDSSQREETLAILKRHWGEKAAPALSFVQGKLPIAGVQVAIDAVAAVPCKPGRVGVELLTEPVIPGHRGPVGAILPGGRVIHIAGQAEQGEDARESTRNTLSHLLRTLEWQGAGWKDAVSIKCFLTPIESAPMVIEEVRAACGENHPPVVFVEWQSGLPIEIEVVANVGSVPLEPNGAGAVRYLTPPDMTASPVYSRVAVTGGGPMIYVSGLLAEERAAADPESETRDLFRQLREILSDPACGSDLKHLVKATYYCSHDSTSSALNGVRPDYYDPARPPAASKAIVPGVGHAGRKITLDMIAVRRSDR